MSVRQSLVQLLGTTTALSVVLMAPWAPTGVEAAPAETPAPTVAPGEPWWVPLGLRGMSVSAVSEVAGGLEVVASGRALFSDDGGHSFVSAPRTAAPVLDPEVDAETRAGDDVWALRAGRVWHARVGEALAPDPGGPDLGAGARLLAAPAADPAGPAGRVVAVSSSGTVWRRSPEGRWDRALLLLPQGLWTGPPRVTAVAAFSAPLSSAIYLGTDGYSVLLSQDGGDDWFRAGPGLPDHVLALAADGSARAVFAGTDDGLWVHRLRSLPGVPSYPGPDLLWRWLAVAALTLAAGAAAVVAMRWSLAATQSAAGRLRVPPR